MRSSPWIAAALIVLTGAADPVKQEVWEGRLTLNGGIKVRIVLNVAKSADGTLKATLDSPDQGAKGLNVDAVAVGEGVLKFELKVAAAEFSGKLDDEQTEAVGAWKQGGVSLPLTLKKVDKASVSRRPQTPMPPFPYDESAVSYENKAGGVTLAGTLTAPRGPGPFPAVILISGSGAQDRDETILDHKPFLVLADFLTRRGIAVLRVDDRGVGGSSGKTTTSTSDDFAGDVMAGIAFLKSRPEIDPARIGLIGHSEGGIIAPIVATRSGDVAFIVLMAGTGLPGDEVLAEQGRLILDAMGAKDVPGMGLEINRRLFEVAKDEKDDKAALKRMRAILKESLADLPEADRKRAGGEARAIESQLGTLLTPWFRFFLAYDPRPTLSRVRCPVLAMIGEKDLQVAPGQNLVAIEQALKAAKNEHVTIRELPKLNHLFQTSESGSPSEYASIEETIAPSALTLIGDWIGTQVGTAR